jgi:glycerate kinase
VLKYYLKTKTVNVKSVNALFQKIDGYYEWNSAKKIAIVELAVCSGIALLKSKERNPSNTSTYGTGLLIQHAINKGAKKIILGLGGSATNDAGMGIASALGFIFLDKKGNELMPIGASLNHIHSIRKPARFPKIEFDIAIDVNNPLFGKNGAAFIYGPQKGAKAKQIEILDKGLKNISTIIKKQAGLNVSKQKGLGAAGGVAAMLVPFFKTRLMSGIDLVMEVSEFKKHIKSCDLLITGEGKIDEQSFQGKVVGTFLNHSKPYKLNILLIAGKMEGSFNQKLKQLQCLEIQDKNRSLDYSIKNAKKLLFNKTNYFFQTNY